MKFFSHPSSTNLPQLRSGQILLLGLLLWIGAVGCQTTPDPEEDAVRTREPIGKVVAVYPGDNAVIVRLNTLAVMPAANEEGVWITRNPAGRVTSVLTPTTVRSGRSIGFHIREGLPNTEDDVFFRN